MIKKLIVDDINIEKEHMPKIKIGIIENDFSK